MSNVLFECLYCGHKFEQVIWSALAISSIKCETCQGKKLRTRKLSNEKRNIFGYPEDGQSRQKDAYFDGEGEDD